MSTTAKAGTETNEPRERRVWKKAFVLCFFFGFFGAHRFYAGRWKTAIAQLVTFGGLGLWSAYDLFCIWTERFADGSGHPLARA